MPALQQWGGHHYVFLLGPERISDALGCGVDGSLFKDWTCVDLSVMCGDEHRQSQKKPREDDPRYPCRRRKPRRYELSD